MDGYKKLIVFGCLLLGAGYFLPWFVDADQTVNGVDMLYDVVEVVRPMQQNGSYDPYLIIMLAPMCIPAICAVLSFLYCMIKPLNRNGFLGSLFFVLPLLLLALAHGFFHAGGQPGLGAEPLLNPLLQGVSQDYLDLAATGGLWLVHLGALLMFLGRLVRGNGRKPSLR
ncbi:MAG: hypothetical protein PHX58_13595 [Desulfovibrio sp.]|nr:hypothetical protein [Desulfovibrio sp.]